MRVLADRIRRFARADANVLITAETGCGKNAVAREIHARGPRARRPFVTIDCASLSPALMDANLFGYERGAFTDAIVTRPGRFEFAGSGTVYLDMVSELALDEQAKLLRVVDEKLIERLGSRLPIVVGARIVASVGADIDALLSSGAFRRDLYYRLRVLPLAVPPLREHREDVPPLVRYFLKRAAVRSGGAEAALTRHAADALQRYEWPGNIRQLRNTIERAYLAADGGRITVAHLPEEIYSIGA